MSALEDLATAACVFAEAKTAIEGHDGDQRAAAFAELSSRWKVAVVGLDAAARALPTDTPPPKRRNALERLRLAALGYQKAWAELDAHVGEYRGVAFSAKLASTHSALLDLETVAKAIASAQRRKTS